MPTQNQVRKYQAPCSFGTYGATGKVTWLDYLNSARTRTWSNSTYRTQLQRAQRILAVGYLPTHSYQDDLQHVVNSKLVTASGKVGTASNATFLWRFIPQVSRVTCSVNDSDVVLALGRALDSAQSRISGQGVNVPMTILEAGKTADMIGEAAGRLYKAYRHVKHGNFLAAAKAVGLEKVPRRVGRYKTPSQNWLEYRYGWRLVVYDITSYMNTIYEILKTKPIVYRMSGRSTSTSRTVSTKTGQNVGTGSFPAIINYTQKRVVTRNVEATAGYVYALESTALSTGQSLGLLNPALVVWDFLPGSFMADWAANVSSVLEGLTAFQGKKFLDGWECRAVHTLCEESWIDCKAGYSVKALDPVAFSSPVVEERRFLRQPASEFHAASLRLDFNASFKNAIDGLALINQIFKSRR